MAVKRTKYKKSQNRKPFWERILELFLLTMKKLLIPALLIWLIGWLWLGGIFAATKTMAWNGFVNWTANQGLVVNDVIVEGRDRTNLQSLQASIGTQLNDPILSVHVNAIQKNIELLPWVDTAIVGRNYNGIVTIQMIERIPFVLWDRPGRAEVVVDTKGHIIKGANPNEFNRLLSVRGVDAPQYTVDLMQMILAEPTVAKHIRGAEWIGDRRWDLITTNGTRVHLPAEDIGYALSRLAKTQNEKNIFKRNLLSIDLRGNDRIIIETEPGKSQDIMSLSSSNPTNSI